MITRLKIQDDQGNKIYFETLRMVANEIGELLKRVSPRQKTVTLKWGIGHARMVESALRVLAAASPDELPNPDETADLDFVGIGFEGGAAAVLDAIKKEFPGFDFSFVKTDKLRAEWAEEQADYASLLGFNQYHDKAFTVSHAWSFRWFASQFISYMRSRGAHNYVAQIIEVRPALTAPAILPEMVIIACTKSWWDKVKDAADRAIEEHCGRIFHRFNEGEINGEYAAAQLGMTVDYFLERAARRTN